MNSSTNTGKNLIKKIKQKLIEENLYNEKDEVTLQVLEDTYNQYIDAVKHVKKEGTVITSTNGNGISSQRLNPYYTVSLEQKKELQKLLDALFSTPKSRKAASTASTGDNQLSNIINSLDEIDKR